MDYLEINDIDIQDFEYETTVESDGQILGVCELGKATFQLLNDSNNYNIFKESWIKTIHGSFYVYDVKPVQERVNIKLECYDIKYKLDTPYQSKAHLFPCTIKTWRNAIFEECGVNYDDSEFPHSDTILESEPYVGSDSSNRNVIAQIGKACSSVIVTDSDDIFYFDWFSDTEHTVDDWIELTTESVPSKPINCLVVGRGDVEDNVCYPTEKPDDPVGFRIDNNYILDSQEISSEDERYANIIPLYNRINGFSYLIFNMRTQDISEKLSLKLGEKIKYKDIWGNELTAYVMTKKIKFLGGDFTDDDNYEITLSAEKIKETATDLSYARSTINDLLEVSRKADKNSGKIEDLVREFIEESGVVNENFAQVFIDINNIINSVQKSGGTNLIKNSVMFAYDSNYIPENWELSEEGQITISSSPEAYNNGSISGHVFTLANKTVRQRVYVKADSDNIPEEQKNYYTFSCKIKKNITGTCYIKLYNSIEEHLIQLDSGQESFYGEYELKALLPKDSYYDIEFYGSEDSNATFTDVMFTIGKDKKAWSQANGEIMNTQVVINENGVVVKSAIYAGDYTIMSPLEFAGYSMINGVKTKVFTLNKDTTLVKKLESEDEIKMKPIKIVPIRTGPVTGWAFTKSGGYHE